MKYYYPENVSRYQWIETEGEKSCNERHISTDLEKFSSRAFLEEILPRLRFSVSNPLALEYGCGIGPGACFLARRGFQVDGIDIIPVAIEMAKKLASEQGLDVHYEVQDICKLPHTGKKYDIIVDSYCLQGIVTDADRESVFAVVRARLKSDGYYLVSTAMFDEDRFSAEPIVDKKTGIVYNRYGDDGLINARTSIVYEILKESPEDYEEAIKIGDTWYLPNRRHLKAPALKAELESAGFNVLYQSGDYGESVICTLKGAAATLHPVSGGELCGQ